MEVRFLPPQLARRAQLRALIAAVSFGPSTWHIGTARATAGNGRVALRRRAATLLSRRARSSGRHMSGWCGKSRRRAGPRWGGSTACRTTPSASGSGGTRRRQPGSRLRVRHEPLDEAAAPALVVDLELEEVRKHHAVRVARLAR